MKGDKFILQKLATEIAEIACKPVQKEKIRLWKALNGLKPERPMVTIDQVCWNELNTSGELTLQCEVAEAREYEMKMRQLLYQWHHFPVDMVVEPFISVPMAVRNSGFGISVKENIAIRDRTSSVVSHAYINQFEYNEDIESIQTPLISLDADETDRRLSWAHEVFDNILEVKAQGVDPYLSVWDPISTWMGVQEVLFALIDRPEFMMAMANRLVNGYLYMLDQLEEQGLLVDTQQLIHCTGAYSDDLPAPDFNPKKPRAKDLWMFGLAQMFSTVSPDMFETFEIEPCMPLFERFGLVYYGCCDPLDRKMKQVRRIPNLRKISMSPWVDEMLGASQIGKDYVYSRKPNPAFLAMPNFDEQLVREHLQHSVDVCRQFGCPLELILKDISTVNYEPQRLWRWAEIAMDIVQG